MSLRWWPTIALVIGDGTLFRDNMALYSVASGEILAAIGTWMCLFHAGDMGRLVTLQVYRCKAIMVSNLCFNHTNRTHHVFEQSSFRNHRIGKGAKRSLRLPTVRQAEWWVRVGRLYVRDPEEMTVHI